MVWAIRHRCRSVLLAVVWTALGGVTSPVSAAAPAGNDAHRFITVMTRNLDTGTDFGPVFTAKTAAQFLGAAADVYQEVLASRPVERAKGIAREIAATKPDLVSLQEVSLWRTGAFLRPPATTVTIDQLDALEQSLIALGLHYAPVAILTEGDFEAPTALGFNVRFTDRDVILARTDLPPGHLRLTNVQSTHFQHVLTLPIVGGAVTVTRGWISVDATVRGRTIRFLSTHLEALLPAVQQAEVAELLAGPAATSLPVVLAGDLNTGPGVSAAYSDLIAAGWVDTWVVTNRANPGFTWPLHGEDPFTPFATPFQRIDLVLVRGSLQPVSDRLVGNLLSDLTPSALWPSDHAGVASRMRIPS